MAQIETKVDPLVPDDVFREMLGGISRTKQWRLQQSDPDFPAKIKIGVVNYRRLSAINAYLDKKEAEATAQATPVDRRTLLDEGVAAT